MAPPLDRPEPPDLACGRDRVEGLLTRVLERGELGRDALVEGVRPLLAVRPERPLPGWLWVLRSAGGCALFRTGRPSDGLLKRGSEAVRDAGVPVRFVGAPTRPLGRDLVCPVVRRGGGMTLPLGVGPAVRERSATSGEDPVRRDPTLPEGRIPPGDEPPAVTTGVAVRRRGLTAGVASGDLRPR